MSDREATTTDGIMGRLTADHDGPRIYVASLSDYNAGRLHGRWIDAAQDAEDIHEEVREMLAQSPEPIAEEWAIHDYDGFHGLKIDEYESFEKVAELAQLIEEHGEAYAKFAEYVGAEYATAESFEDAYRGKYDSERAFAEDLAEEVGMFHGVNDSVANYFDYDSFAHDLFMGDCFSAESSEGGVHVFWNN